jgi:hypothetical protein
VRIGACRRIPAAALSDLVAKLRVPAGEEHTDTTVR